MKKHIILSAIAFLAVCLCASAQNSQEGTLRLRNGNQVTGQIEMQADGGAKVITTTGDTFYFSAGEISSFKAADNKKADKNKKQSSRNKGKKEAAESAGQNTIPSSIAVPGMKYSEYKKMYSPHDYVRQNGDPYSPGLATALSCILPGVGQAVVGRWGSAVAFEWVDVAGTLSLIAGLTGYSDNISAGNEILFIAGGGALMAITRIWSAINANKVAKIKNLYFRDVQGQSAVQFDLEPYVGQIGTLAMQPQTVTGLTLRITF